MRSRNDKQARERKLYPLRASVPFAYEGVIYLILRGRKVEGRT